MILGGMIIWMNEWLNQVTEEIVMPQDPVRRPPPSHLVESDDALLPHR